MGVGDALLPHQGGASGQREARSASVLTRRASRAVDAGRVRGITVMHVRELVDSMALAADQTGLRRRLAGDGYLFFRRLLRPADVQAAHESVHAELTLGGWTTSAGYRAGARRTTGVREALEDPSFRAALASRGLNRLAYLPPLRGLVRLILGAGAFCYPVKVLRVVYPERRGTVTRSRYVHQDFGISGVQDMLTTWLPLMDIPPLLGGLALLPGSHLGPPQRPRLLPPDAPGWATTDFGPGDVLLFHCLTAHAALPNHADRIRISADFRWQAADQPAPAELVLRPAADGQTRRGGQAELYSELLAAEPWWEPVPSGLMLRSRREMAAVPPAQSRLFAVHPGWQRWREPARPVH